MGIVNFKLETFADPGWNLVFQRGSTISSQITTNAEIYSENSDLFVLIDKVKGRCPVELESMNLGKIREWFLLVAKDEEWFHKDVFTLSYWDNKCSAFLSLDYIFDNYEVDYEKALSCLFQILKKSKVSANMKTDGELIVQVEGEEISEVVETINQIITAYPPKKSSLLLDQNWTLFLDRLNKVLHSLSLSMPSIKNVYSFNKLTFMNLLSQAIEKLQKKEGKEPILIQFSTMLTFMKSNPSVGDDFNSQLADLNRFLGLELIDWAKISEG